MAPLYLHTLSRQGIFDIYDYIGENSEDLYRRLYDHKRKRQTDCISYHNQPGPNFDLQDATLISIGH